MNTIDSSQVRNKMMFHELINPLNSVKINLSIAKQKSKDLKELNKALNAINYATELINYYKSLNNRQLKANKNFYLLDEIKNACKILEFKISQENITIKMKIANYSIRGNKFSFRQIIINLIKNSIEAYQEYANKRDKIITLKSAYRNNSYIIDFIDYAGGVTNKNSEDIFKPFVTNKKFNKDNLGLGLTICQNIIKKDFKGEIRLISPKSPTIFRLIIPDQRKSKFK